MTAPRQDYASHRRYHPMWHFVATPILMIAVVMDARTLLRERTGHAAWDLVFTFGIALAVFAARVQTLNVQNRVIRLEMRLRLQALLPAELAARSQALSLSQLVGLRFAGDGELPSLVERCLSGELPSAESVKKQIKDWQPDWLRA